MTKQPTKTKSIYNKIVKGLWIAFIGVLLLVPIYVISVNHNFLNLYGGMPNLRELDNPKDELSSQLFSADGELLGKYFLPNSNRTPIIYEDLSPNLINALLAAEDIRFHDHSGIDLRGVMRGIVGFVTFTKRGGGSTITQQLAKNLFGTRSDERYKGALTNMGIIGLGVVKTKEWILSVILESKYTKEEIMAMYLNTVPFGNNSFGIKVASKTYFNTTPDSLTIPEAAVLVGLVNAPSRFNPVRFPDRATRKRNRIIDQMLKYDYISQNECDSLKALELGLNFRVENHNEGPAPYFRAEAQKFLKKWARENNQDLYEGGLKIYTSIDSRLQKLAEESVVEHMVELQEKFDEHWKGRNPWIDENWKEIKNFIEDEAKKAPRYRQLVNKYGRGSDSIDIVMNLPREMTVFSWGGEKDTVLSPMDSIRYFKRFLHTGFMAMDPHTGQVKAWVGGINHKYFQYDHVRQGSRQPGSTFKPFVYATAIEYGLPPCLKVANVPVTFPLPGQNPPIYTPENSTNDYDGEKMTIREAMARSINRITAYLMKRVGPENVVQKAKLMGIQSELDAVPSLCLGVSPVSLFELVGAYGTFVNEGVWIKPSFITRIEDKDGNVLYNPTPTTVEALSEEHAYIMLHMLKGSTEVEGGTGQGLGWFLKEGNEIGAKTGTTQNASDGWFMGVTKDLVAGAWVGGDNRSIHFRSWVEGQGARTAMPIYKKFLTKIYQNEELGYEKGPFKRPVKRLPMELDCDKYEGLIFNEVDSVMVDTTDKIEEKDIF
ncbi:transglycosylase domain-containing protein [Fulvivirgaceae bacterium BMA10]|uniref:Transglycosylase domain-containing protein n=1 Tax=Splendidivirga corallicola TaxID=3051826 RepID=A0ABT8KXA9_9BACT|nr:transglycosylase domain-containing protein [Fulvivirgaceae bacterium BMA10]